MRYLKIYKWKIILSIAVVALTYYSAIHKGNYSKIAAYIVGVSLIYLASTFVIWIIRTPIKKDNNKIV